MRDDTLTGYVIKLTILLVTAIWFCSAIVIVGDNTCPISVAMVLAPPSIFVLVAYLRRPKD